MSKGRVENKVAIVTGAGTGIGRASAKMLAAEGATVLVTDIDTVAAQATTKLITDEGGKAESMQLDVTNAEQWDAVFEHVIKAHGDLDVLVNNAGIAPPKLLAELSLDEFRKVNDINLHGTFIGCKGAIATMRSCSAEGGPAVGSIINIASVAGQQGMRTFAAYCTGKAAVTNMCNALGVEMGEMGDLIRMNSVHPGPVKTELTVAIVPEGFYDDDANFANLPLQKCVEVDDIAYAVLYLASDESRLVTGSQMNVDSGFNAGFLAEMS
jgi:NAD(P)-dependent dehydrogenase (short-subunit alcohol dehydrogenase family)